MKRSSYPWFLRVHSTVSQPKSSFSTTNKFGSGIFTVMFGFTLWVLIHERTGRINTKLLLPTLALHALATAVSQLREFMHRMIHLLRQAFDHRHISRCEGLHHIQRCTRWPYWLFQQFIKNEQPHQRFILCSTNSVGRLLLGKKIWPLVSFIAMIPFHRSTGARSYGNTIYG